MNGNRSGMTRLNVLVLVLVALVGVTLLLPTVEGIV